MKLTKDNYFSQEMSMKFMGVSQYKAFEKCSAAALAEINGEYEREKLRHSLSAPMSIRILKGRWTSLKRRIRIYSKKTAL